MRILIIEDEVRLAKNLNKGLSEEGFTIDVAHDGEEGQYLAETEEYDLIILDINLPKINGLIICRHLREKKIKTPILMLTARSTLEDKVSGLDTGADDYLTKPFSFLELRSRIQALIRRSRQQPEPTLRAADLEVDPLKRTVLRNKKFITLTLKEFSVLEFLLHHKGEAVTRTMLLEHVWDFNFEGMSNVVDVYIATLRNKIDKNHSIKLIHTIHGVGYMIGKKDEN